MNDKILPSLSDQDGEKERETDQAVQEEAERANETALKRNNRFIRHSGRIGVGLMWFFAAALVATMGVWLVHFLTPWTWLDADQLSKIQTVIFSGSLSAIVATFFQRHILGSSRE